MLSFRKELREPAENYSYLWGNNCKNQQRIAAIFEERIVRTSRELLLSLRKELWEPASKEFLFWKGSGRSSEARRAGQTAWDLRWFLNWLRVVLRPFLDNRSSLSMVSSSQETSPIMSSSSADILLDGIETRGEQLLWWREWWAEK